MPSEASHFIRKEGNFEPDQAGNTETNRLSCQDCTARVFLKICIIFYQSKLYKEIMLINSLREISRQTINVAKLEDASVSWHNTGFTIRTSKEIYVFEFSHVLHSMDKKMDFNVSSIPIPKSSPATYLVSNNFISYGVSNFELLQLVIDPSLWPHSAQIVQEMSCAIDCKWSPDFYFNREPILALLNNIGNVTIFGKKNGNWLELLDLSSCVNKKFKLVLPTCVEDLKTKVDIVESSALCFLPTINDACSIILGQKNGSLLLWSLKVENDEKLRAYFQGSIESDPNEVKSILWIDKHDKKGIFVVSNILGQIILYECIINKNIKMINMHLIWPHRDNMITHHLNYAHVNNKIILVYNKHRHLVVQLLDENCKVISQYSENVNDHKISSIVVKSNKFLLATVNIQMFKISIDVVNDNLDVRLNLIEIKDSYKNYELLDIDISHNNRMITALIMEISVNVRKKMPQIDILFFTPDSNNNSNLSFLLHKEIKSIVHVWDAIELVRHNILKTKSLPITELEQLITDGETDTNKLKLYLVIANIYCNVVNNLKIINPKRLPEEIEKVKEKIILKHAQSQLNAIHKLIVQNNVSNFEMEVFNATKTFLNYYSQKHNVKLEKIISLAVYNSVKDERKYICQCCDNEINGFLCSSGHINMFCPITFLPIETSDYLICVVCGITARKELFDRKVKCIFCDKYLQKYE